MTIAPIFTLLVLAQATSAAPDQNGKAKAERLLDQGGALYDKGDYAHALEAFEAAHAAFPSPMIWFNIGQANRDLGRPVEALQAFQRFLDEATGASSEERSDALSAAAELQKGLAQLTVLCDRAGAVIGLDGRSVGNAPLLGPLWVTPGQHQVSAAWAGTSPILETVRVAAGAQSTVTLTIPGLASRVPAASLGTSAPSPATSPGWWLGRQWTWVAAGSTILLTGAAVGFGLSFKSRYDELDRSCGSQSPGRLGCSESDRSAVQTRATVANVFWGLAGAAALTTTVLFVLERPRVAVAPLAGEATGVVAWMGF